MFPHSSYTLAPHSPRLLDVCLPKPSLVVASPSLIPYRIQSLRLLGGVATLTQRYQCYLPQFSAWAEETFAWQAEDASEQWERLVTTFLIMVEEYLFPIWTEVLDEDMALTHVHLVPIYPQGLDIWQDLAYDDYREPLRLLLYLTDPCRVVTTPSSLAETYPQFYFPPDFDIQNLIARLQRMDLATPLQALLDTIAFVQQETGNFWLDTGVYDWMEEEQEVYWDSPEEIEWLRAQWQTARPQLERIHQLLDWCHPQNTLRSEPIEAHLAQVVYALQTAYVLEQNDDPFTVPTPSTT